MAEEDDPGAKIEGLLKTLAETARCDHVIRSKSTTSGNVLPPLLDYDTELRFLEAEDLLHGMRESSREIERDVAQLKSGNLPVDMHDDAPLKLEDAICLPELAGAYTVGKEFRRSSESFTVKTLRLAIERGELRTIRPNAKNLYVTRRFIREWLERCQGQENPPISSYVVPVRANMEGSPTRQSTSSKTALTSTARDAALTILQGLKSNSTTISSRNMRKR
jgi:hypothetical protein